MDGLLAAVWRSVFLDEGHRIKNEASDVSMACLGLKARFKVGKRDNQLLLRHCRQKDRWTDRQTDRQTDRKGAALDLGSQ